MIVHEHNKRDSENRMHVARVFFPANAVLFTNDGVHLYLTGFVNEQNFRYLTESIPQQLHEKHLHSQYVTVCCAVTDLRVYGPYFFLKKED